MCLCHAAPRPANLRARSATQPKVTSKMSGHPGRISRPITSDFEPDISITCFGILHSLRKLQQKYRVWLSHRKWKTGCTGLNRIIPFPVRHPMSPHGVFFPLLYFFQLMNFVPQLSPKHGLDGPLCTSLRCLACSCTTWATSSAAPRLRGSNGPDGRRRRGTPSLW